MVNSGSARLTGSQLRAARALLNLSAEALSAESKVGLRTIGRAEKENGTVRMTAANTAAVIAALETRGVCFLSSDDNGVGVCLRLKPPPSFGS